ncbi:succinate dehydrogenase, hydrophobic membrane anchor protein [Methylocella silvestris]|uniref:Succinate dehydrogenase hydrophobic membrane anchor subunit n=1 Tax=Methylocella silvestris TaxID=199596 RepID=A0A2J7TLJ1_METSI|nr:succinate dehydrogenase, hydrophobic membrane anchor protein [Methylocella silvestris]PNG27636.1 succinate dehydrogenase, hydrophobic membrane anchor protein [Methylocella silvestris]
MAHDNSSSRSPARKGFLGSAKSGAGDAWSMHVTSVALLPLAIGFVWVMLSLMHKDYAGVKAELGHPLPAIVLLLFILAGCWHMKLGMQSIIDDYIHAPHAKEWALVGNFCFSAAVALASVFAVVKLGLS